MDPSEIEDMFEHLEDPDELDFEDDTYQEEEDYFLDDGWDDESALASAGWGMDEDYGYFGEDEY